MGVSNDADFPHVTPFINARTYLDDGALAGNFEDLAFSCLAVSELDVHDLGEPIEIGWLATEVTGACACNKIVSLTWGI